MIPAGLHRAVGGCRCGPQLLPLRVIMTIDWRSKPLDSRLSVGGAPVCGRDFDDEEITYMSTLTVDDELYQRAAEAAAAQGKTVDEFVGEALRQALAMVGVWRTVRNGLPVMVVSDDTLPIHPAQVPQGLEE